MFQILVVEDNANSRRLFEVILTQNGFTPLLAPDCERAKQILEKDRDLMDQLAGFLLEKETITGEEFMAILREADGK